MPDYTRRYMSSESEAEIDTSRDSKFILTLVVVVYSVEKWYDNYNLHL